MKQELETRILQEAEYFLMTHGATVRSTAKHFGLSKSTVHLDLSKRLKQTSFLWLATHEKLQRNKEERALRGGEATRKKYLEERKDS